MPTARGFAGAAVAGGKIYVIGGYDGKEALAVNEEYLPERDTWSRRAPLPAGR
ncbi:MAG: galactose oxidase, partial [Anaerolineae bacterium CG17_big_fil_post_rev_8_21_14_2_50_57_27]